MISIPNVSFIDRNAMPLQQLTNLFLKRLFSMMFGLFGDIDDKSLNKLGRPFRAGLRLRISPRAKARLRKAYVAASYSD